MTISRQAACFLVWGKWWMRQNDQWFVMALPCCWCDGKESLCSFICWSSLKLLEICWSVGYWLLLGYTPRVWVNWVIMSASCLRRVISARSHTHKTASKIYCVKTFISDVPSDTRILFHTPAGMIEWAKWGENCLLQKQRYKPAVNISKNTK